VAESFNRDPAAADRAARETLEANRGVIASMLAPKRGVAFVGSAEITEAQRFQFARYGDSKICIVNPKGGDAGDIPVYSSMLEVPDEIELAVVRVGAARVAQVIEDCGRRGVRQALVFSDGFSEVGPEGARLERELQEAARRAGVRIIGPNTNDNAFESFPRPENHRGGAIAMVTQSGANGRSVVEGVAMGACFHRWVTVGNEIDLEVADFINYFAHQDEVSAIALYVEGFKSAAKIRVALEQALLLGKPVIAIKMGATERGAKMAASHTGHLAGADAVIEGLFRQYGVIRVDDLDELLEIANLFSKLPQGCGTRGAFYTMSGGTSALMSEQAEKHGVPAPELPQALQDRLHEHIQKNLSVANPIDNGGVFIMRAQPEERLQVLDMIASDSNIDLMVFGLNAAYGPVSDRIGADILKWSPTAAKPTVAVWASVITDTQGYCDLVASGVPIFRSFRKCMKGLAAFQAYAERRGTARVRTIAAAELTAAQKAGLAAGGGLSASAATRVLMEAGVPMAGERLVATAAQAGAAASELGFPVALKLMSADFPHKTDVGLLKLGVATAADAEAAAQGLLDRARALKPDARIDGVLVQEQVSGGVEVIVGLTQDPQFGPALTIGAGGIYAEILKDVAVAPLPVDADDVREMIARLRIAPLLAGARGARPADVEGLVDLALKVARLAQAAGGRIEELDLNPVVVRPDRVVAVDALVIAAAAPTLAPA
jgi:acyl-CoA synthetase (NDP forming)